LEESETPNKTHEEEVQMANLKFLKQPKFGSKEFFVNYLSNQISEEGKTQEVIHRVHFAMSNFIFEVSKGKEALNMLKNLNDACEELSEYKKVTSYL
jgi:hypothetical protein